MAQIANKAAQDANKSNIGLASLVPQVYRRATKKGFEFSIIIVGETGLGKSTLIHTLFMQEESNSDTESLPRNHLPAASRVEKTVKITPHVLHLTEHGVNLTLTLIDTPGFSDAVNNEKVWGPIVAHLDAGFMAYLNDESKVNRKNIEDRRVHACLYFINPVSRGLKTVDIEAMRALHEKVNIVPVIAKADTLTQPELKLLKAKILGEIEEHGIKIYRPALDEDDDEDQARTVHDIITNMPFAVVGSTNTFEVGGRIIRGRKYPWGIVDVNNDAHCDFNRLRNMLVRTQMQDLKEITEDHLYEMFRGRVLEQGTPPLLGHLSPQEVDQRRVREEQQADRNMKVVDSEAAVLARHTQIKKDLEEQAKMLEEKRKQFEDERKRLEAVRSTTSSNAHLHDEV